MITIIKYNTTEPHITEPIYVIFNHTNTIDKIIENISPNNKIYLLSKIDKHYISLSELEQDVNFDENIPKILIKLDDNNNIEYYVSDFANNILAQNICEKIREIS